MKGFQKKRLTIILIIIIILIIGYFFYPLCGFKKIGSEKNGCKCTLIGVQFCEGNKINSIDKNIKNEINDLLQDKE